MRHLLSAMLVVVGVIHLLPLSGLLGSARLAQLYGLSLNESNLVLLLRHRAVLFGLLGGFFMVAAFRPRLQTMALIAGFVSVGSFLWLAAAAEPHNDQIGRIVTADWIALLCLVIGAVARLRE